jgi:serine/threonine protein kinase
VLRPAPSLADSPPRPCLCACLAAAATTPTQLLDLAIDRNRLRFHVKIADFGLARMLGPASNIAVSKVTNPRWSAPEVIKSSTVATPADVYSFAVVMWEMMTWQQPYEEMMSVQVRAWAGAGGGGGRLVRIGRAPRPALRRAPPPARRAACC